MMSDEKENEYIDAFLGLFKNQNKKRIVKQRQIYKAGKNLKVEDINNEETKDNE